jgi:RHS repeat-associated protein
MKTVFSNLVVAFSLAFVAVILIIASTPALAQTKVTYFHNDLSGNPVAASNSAGQIIWRESYRPYGERLKNEAASQSNSQWYTGHRQDADTGLVYMGARHYDPLMGRFLSIDPSGFSESNPHSFNRYAYANNNPLKFIDPDGRISIFVGGLMDSNSKIVSDYYASYKATDSNSRYFEWTQSTDIQKLIKDQPAGEPINLIGHSYGGSTVADIAASSERRIANLITIDPVGAGALDFAAIRKNTDMWVNVNATPKSSDFSDFVATMGGKWGNSPQGNADSYITADQNHGKFKSMMNTGGAGARTPRQVLDGSSTPE